MKTMAVKRLKLDLTSEHEEQLEIAARLCRKARNAGIENWLLRQRGLPMNEKQAKKQLTESTKIYHAMTAAVPELSANLVAALASEVNSSLNAKVDWRKNGTKKRRRSEDILDYEQRPPFSQALKIPVQSQGASFVYGAQSALSLRIVRASCGGEKMSLPVLVKNIGRKDKIKLLEISNGERKLQDSSIVYKQEKNSWYWMLPIKEEGADPLGEDVELDLVPTLGDEEGRGDRPFRVGSWFVGEGRYLLAMTKRLLTAEKEIGYVYRNRRTGAGHGRKKRDQAIKRKRIQRRHQVEEFRRRLICDIIRQCERHSAGTLIYREPSLNVRKRCWFARRGIDWDWARFLQDLENAAARAGVKVEVKMLKWKEALPKEQEETAAGELHAV